MTIEEKRVFVSNFAGKLYAAGASADVAAAIAYEMVREFDEEWDAMTPDQQLARYQEAVRRLTPA